MEFGSVPQNSTESRPSDDSPDSPPEPEAVASVGSPAASEPVVQDRDEPEGFNIADEDAALRRAILSPEALATAASVARARGDIEEATAADRAHADALEAREEAKTERE